MLTLSGKVIQMHPASTEKGRQMMLLSTNPNLPKALRDERAFLITGEEIPDGFRHYLAFDRRPDSIELDQECTLISRDFDYLTDNDVVTIEPNQSIRVLYRAKSPHNSVMVTEQCNHYCLMCSQPPKNVNDRWLLDEAFSLVRIIPQSTSRVMCITGGEPTLWGDDFIKLVQHFKNYLPHTALHILSNGRRFADLEFTKKYARVNHVDLMVGIPIYSSDPVRHDYVVQAKGEFD